MFRKTKVKILAILGNSEGIDLEEDRRELEKLPNAEVRFLEEPTRDKLCDYLWEKNWDIIFFAGHSFSNLSEQTGWISINPEDRLEISQLKEYLDVAVENGLKIAIFNSCAGLGLARVLVNSQISYVIVMGRPVSDRVAHAFLKYFLWEFSRGSSIYTAVSKARRRLQNLENKGCPGATWLPVLCQHPEAQPFTWPWRVPELLYPLILVIILVFSGALIQQKNSRSVQNLTMCPGNIENYSKLSIGNRSLYLQDINEKRLTDFKDGCQKLLQNDWNLASDNFKNAMNVFQSNTKTNSAIPKNNSVIIYSQNANVYEKVAENNKDYKVFISVVAVPLQKGEDDNSSSVRKSANEILLGAGIFQKQFNEKYLDKGYGLVLIIADDSNDSDLIQQKTDDNVAIQITKISEDMKEKTMPIIGIVGHFGSKVTRLAAPFYQDKQLLLINATSTSISIREKENLSKPADNINIVYRIVPSVIDTAKAMVKYLDLLNRQLNYEKVIVISTENKQDSYTGSLLYEFQNEFKQKFPNLNPVYLLSNNEGKLQEESKNLKDGSATALILLLDATERAKLKKYSSYIKKSSSNFTVIGADTLFNEDSGNELFRLCEDNPKIDIAVVTPWYDIKTDPNLSINDKKIEEIGTRSWRVRYTYDALLVLTAAAYTSTIKNHDLNINNLIGNLSPKNWDSSFSFTSTTGIDKQKLLFNTNGDRDSNNMNQSSQVWQIKAKENGQQCDYVRHDS